MLWIFSLFCFLSFHLVYDLFFCSMNLFLCSQNDPSFPLWLFGFFVSCFTLPLLTLHLIELNSQTRHAQLVLRCLHAFSQLLFHINFVSWSEEGEKAREICWGQTLRQVLITVRDTCSKGGSFPTRLRVENECLKHQERQPSRADKKHP